MSPLQFSRRRFAGLLGAGVGSALVAYPVIATSAAQAAPALKAVSADSPATLLTRLDSNENPYGPSPAARSAIAAADDLFCRYPDDLETKLMALIARQHGVAPEQVILGCGSGELLRIADMAFLSAGRKVVAAEPTFESVLEYAGVTQAEKQTIALDADYRHDLPRMAAACDERTGLAYVCNPNNPTATVVSGAALETFLQSVPPWTMVVVDEAYHHFVEDPGYRSAAEMLDRFANLIVVRTFSKIYGMAGLRLGYAIAQQPVIAAMRRHAFWSNANTAVLLAAITSLEDADLVPRLRAEFSATKRRLYAALDKQQRRYIHSEANFVMIHIGTDVGPLIEAFNRRGMRVGRRFTAMPEYLRISVGTSQEMDRFARLLGELAPAV